MVMHRCSHSKTAITPRGLEDVHQRVRDLGGQPLLHLRAAGEHVDQPGELRQAGDPAVGARDVADVGHSVNGTRWCSQVDQTSMSLTSTSSSWPMSNVVVSTSSAFIRSPPNVSA